MHPGNPLACPTLTVIKQSSGIAVRQLSCNGQAVAVLSKGRG